MAEADAKALVKRFERLKSARANFESHWQEIHDYALPISADFTRTMTPGEKNRQQILDNTAEVQAELLAAALHGFLTNPGTVWFDLRAKNRALNQLPDAAIWLEDARDELLAIFAAPETQFDAQLAPVYLEMVHYGMGSMYGEDRPGRLPLFQARPLAELFVEENAEGVIDATFRRFQLDARQAARAFPDTAGEKVLEAAAKDQPMQVELVHGVYPREDARPGKLDSRSLPFASCWVMLEGAASGGGGPRILRERGYHENPFIHGRWAKRPGEAYGRGPGGNALPDMKMLQRAMRAVIRSVEKIVDPPLLVNDDGVLSPVRVSPSALNPVRGDAMMGRLAPIVPLQTGGRPDVGDEFLQGVRARIGRAFFSHLIEQLRDPRATATQILEIKEEMQRHVGPFLGRIQQELLSPLIARTFGIAARAGLLPPPPPELAEERIEVEYVSPWAKAQRLADARSTVQFFEIINQIVAVDETAKDWADAGEGVRVVHDRLGVPGRVLRSEKAVAAMRQARNQAAEEQAGMAELEQGAKAAQSLAQADAASAGADATRAAPPRRAA